MAGETTRARNPAGHAGFVNSLLALANALAGFLESRLALFAKESRVAFVQLLVLGACLLAAVIFFTLGYLFLVATAVVAIARAAQVSWLTIALCAAGAHFLLAIVCLVIARSSATRPPFRELSAELQKDREWLKDLDQTSRPNR